MKKNTSWKFTDELSVTFQLSVSGAGEFGPSVPPPLDNLPRILMPPSGEGVYARRMLQAGKPAAYMSMFLFNDEEYQIYRDT